MTEKALNRIIAKNITKYLDMSNRTQLELAEFVGVTQATVSNWCQGIKTPRMPKLDKICEYFGIKRSDLMNDNESSLLTTSARKGVTINIYGDVAAGIPIEMIEDIIDTEEIPEDMAKGGTFFGLRIKGDSMLPELREGDYIIIRQQPDAESGDTVVVTVNGDSATCKRLRKYMDRIELIPNNPAYEPLTFSNKEVKSKPVTILGKVVELRRKF